MIGHQHSMRNSINGSQREEGEKHWQALATMDSVSQNYLSWIFQWMESQRMGLCILDPLTQF